MAALAVVLCLALYLRWARLDLIEFTDDQAWVLARARQWLEGGAFPLHGIVTSVGAFQGPMEIYLLALPAALSRDPRLATAFVGLLQVIAIGGCYWLGSRYFGRVVGLTAAALFATNPWALQYSRKVWTPDLLPLFTVGMQLALAAVVVERRRWPAALALVCQAAAVLVHPSAAVFVPVVALVLLARLRHTGLAPQIAGACLSLAVALPYLVFESSRGFDSFKRYLGSTGGGSTVDLEGLKYVTTMVHGQLFPFMMGYGFRDAWQLSYPTLANDLLAVLFWLGITICVGIVGVGAWRRLPARGWLPHLLLLLWLAAPVLGSLRHALVLHPHYFVGVFPAQFLVVAVAVGWLAALPSRLPPLEGRTARLLTVAVLAFAVAGTALAEARFFWDYLDHVEQKGPTRLYGVPLTFSEQAVAQARAASAAHGGAPVYFLVYKQREVFKYLAGSDLQARLVDPPEGLLLPRDPARGAVYVLASDDGNTAEKDYRLLADDGAPLQRLVGMGFAEEPQRRVIAPDGYVYYRVYSAAPERLAAGLAAFSALEPPRALANGLALRGYRHPSAATPGARVEFASLWALPQADPTDPDREHNVFVHLSDRNGVTRAQADAEMPPYRAWRDDDVAVVFNDLALPPAWGPGQLWFDVGAYGRFDRREVPWLDAAAKPTGTALKLDSLVVRPATASLALTQGTGPDFGGAFRLLDHALAEVAPRPGSELAVDLRWGAAAAPRGDYVVSVQMLDASGRMVAQHDAPPGGGDYPTSLWRANDVVEDRHRLAIPADVEPGTFTLMVVVYDQTNGARLPVLDTKGAAARDHFPLATLELR